MLAVSGICLLESDAEGKIKSFRMLLPGSANVRVVERPSWFSAQHLLIILAGVFSVLVVAVSWTVMVSKKNSALRYLIHDKEVAQKELQQAQATLEQRVKERTEQLKFQVTARKESELQFKAVLTERTRLAQELHDTLEQTQTGIALQLGIVAKLFQRNPEGASYHLGLVRTMMRQSQIDLRRSIWDLRCRQLEEFDLPSALAASGQQLADRSGILVEVKTKGAVRPLPEVVEENLLRIGQEALTNVVKHSHASRAEVELEFSPQNVILEIKDDGRGFTPGNCAGPNDGHFGLLGMAERTKRFGGIFWVTSIPGRGTTIHTELPAGQTPPRSTPETADLQTNYEEGTDHSDSRR
jgi:signal transduction histidine kinase